MATYTFWKLLNEFPVEIPLIQRDYAQGREGAKATQIREKFVTDLVTTLARSGNKDLDFVYGSATMGKFVPLDGQQRLTTLFLLHWHLASASNNLENVTENATETVRNILTRFSYETRTSSRDFCRALVTNPIAESDKKAFSEKIRECPWFFRSWAKDPTIKSMLVMLDAIQQHCKTQDSTKLWNNLIAEHSITFQFLNLADFQLTDELYIKMNARGKALTDFENFKAWFGQLVEENSNKEKADRWDISAEDWQNNMDKSWTDLFWRHKGPENHLIDEEFMQFFNGMAVNHYVKYKADADEESIRNLINSSYFSVSDYETCGIISETGEFVKEISSILNQFANHDPEIEKLCKQSLFSFDESKSIFQKFINQENRSITYPDRVRFFALSQFLLKNEGFDIPTFKAWGRVVRNIIENSTIDSAATFKSAIGLIAELSQNCNDIYAFLGSDKAEIKSRFATDQIDEERIKASLILKSQTWEQAVLSIDNHKYFRGDIDFILDFAGISNHYRPVGNDLAWTDEEDNSFLNRFQNYSEKSEAVFDEKGLRIFKEFIWERALLSKGDYLLEAGRNHSFLVSGFSSISWKQLLNHNYRRFVKMLLDEINPQSVVENLEAIIENTLKNLDPTDWRYNFIKHSELIAKCGWQKLIRWRDKNDILLLGSSTTSGYHKEYYSFALLLELRKDNHKVHYQPQKTVSEPKYIYEINGKKLRLYYAYESQEWQYVLNLFNDEIYRFTNKKDLIAFLQGQNYFKPASNLIDEDTTEVEPALIQETESSLT